MNIAVIGYGYWGPNMARNFASFDGTELKYVCDSRPGVLEKARRNHPFVSVTENFDDILKDGSVDAVCITTPAATHAELSLKALSSGRHVLVEKPMAMSSAECAEMAEEAEKRSLTLMVDHTFAYSGAVRKLAEISSDGSLGNLYYFDSVRINLGIVQSDVNVLWDLAVHDLSILFQVSDECPFAVSASGVSHIESKPVDTAYLTLHYNSSFIAHVHVSWLAPVKIRHTTVAGDIKMAIYDDTQSVEKLKVYDMGIDTNSSGEKDKNRLLVEYRAGDIHSPKLDSSEPLSLVTQEFYNSVCSGRKPLTDSEAGMRIVRILEAADMSIKRDGERVLL